MFFRREKRILIIRQDRIGDVILSTPLPREIKRHWPDAHVAMMVRGYTRDLLLHNPHVDEILTDDFTAENRQATFWRQVRELRRRRFSHALMLLPRARYNYLTFLAGIPVRVGVGAILYHLITGVRCVMRHGYSDRRHEADYCLDQLRRIGVPVVDGTPEVHLSAAEQDVVGERRRTFTAGGRQAVGLHVTSGGSAPNWTPAVWRLLLDRLREDASLQILVTDHEVPAAVAGLEGVIYPNVGCGLRESLLNLAALDCLVSSSTGPMHMAAAVEVPTVSLFCPNPSCHPERWGPRGNRAEIVMPAAEFCQTQCPVDTHQCTYNGEAGVAVAEVAAKVQLVLNDTSSLTSRGPSAS
jgi:heptosyltransferase-2